MENPAGNMKSTALHDGATSGYVNCDFLTATSAVMNYTYADGAHTYEDLIRHSEHNYVRIQRPCEPVEQRNCMKRRCVKVGTVAVAVIVIMTSAAAGAGLYSQYFSTCPDNEASDSERTRILQSTDHRHNSYNSPSFQSSPVTVSINADVDVDAFKSTSPYPTDHDVMASSLRTLTVPKGDAFSTDAPAQPGSAERTTVLPADVAITEPDLPVFVLSKPQTVRNGRILFKEVNMSGSTTFNMSAGMFTFSRRGEYTFRFHAILKSTTITKDVSCLLYRQRRGRRFRKRLVKFLVSKIKRNDYITWYTVNFDLKIDLENGDKVTLESCSGELRHVPYITFTGKFSKQT